MSRDRWSGDRELGQALPEYALLVGAVVGLVVMAMVLYGAAVEEYVLALGTYLSRFP